MALLCKGREKRLSCHLGQFGRAEEWCVWSLDPPWAKGTFDAHWLLWSFLIELVVNKCLICEGKADKISIQTVYQWNPCSSGSLKMYFITRLKLGFPRNLLKLNSDFPFQSQVAPTAATRGR